ncbi:LysM peptidoglycan-binding domain-containing protein [Taklimakanibacter lacteus]|uniref:LysM peptidoglycan-binding domain-containing protein n=1 Tax=Taklimakanibacter lacteus TaxID=2268456 RepID=UPI0013C41A0A
MKNPLAVFTGAALATLAALAGLNMTSWKPVPAPDQNVPEAAATPAPETSQETAKTPEKGAETAAVQPTEPPQAETPETKPAEPPKVEAEVKPSLDTVRVESDGQAVVAGRAEPGAAIALKLGEQVIGKGIANSDGSWVVVPDNPLPKGAHEITVEQKSADSEPVMLEQSIAVAIPEKTGQQAMVALTEPGAATKVLQAGDSQQQASAGTTEPATPEQPAAAETTTQPAVTSPETQQTAAAEPPAGETIAKTKAPAGETVVKTEEPATAEKSAETTEPTAKPAKVAENVPLRLDAVDYNDRGDIIFSGRAKPGTAIRLYVDNGDVGDAIVDSGGNWSFAGTDIIKPGTHTLRADQIDQTGKVMARIELPFQREDAAAVAALNTPPATEATQATPPQPGEAKPVAEVESQAAKPAEPQQPETQQPETQQPETQAAESQPSQTRQPETQAQSQQPEAQAPAAETQPQTVTEVAKAEPEASGPAPDQPVSADKKEEVTTAAAAAAEQTAKTTDPDQPRTGKVVIQPGNNLWKLSRVIYGRGKSFTVIYQANKDQIRNPNRIYPGQIFAIPNANPPEQIDPKRKDPLTSAEGGAPQ